MREDELQVLGTEKKPKKYSTLIVAVAALLILVTSFIIYNRCGTSDQKLPMSQEGTTISPALQQTIDSLLNDKLTEINGLQGQIIVMEVETGAIKAMVGLERNFEGKFQHCKNFAYQQEPGSTIMTASLLAMLELGVDTGYVVHTEAGVWTIDDEHILKDHNWRRGGYGDLNLSRVLEVSSNIGISKPIWNLFKGHEQDFLYKLDSIRFGQPTNIEGIEGLHISSYSSPKDSNWVNKDIIWSSIGYNRKIAPIQMLTFYNAIANDGKMVKPTLRPEVTEVINEQIASKTNISIMQKVLEHVVSQGLGRLAGTPQVSVAGKTGTSQVNEYYDHNDVTVSEYHISFCGYFPADAPKYSIIVSMNKLGLPASGGGQAGPIFKEIVEWMITNKMLE